MVLVEGLQMQGQQIPRTQLITAWKSISKKPLSKIKALILSDDDFNHFLHHRSCLEDEFREIEEWGRVLSTKGTDACVFKAEETDDTNYIILVRKNTYHTLEEILSHELSHVARGDL